MPSRNRIQGKEAVSYGVQRNGKANAPGDPAGHRHTAAGLSGQHPRSFGTPCPGAGAGRQHRHRPQCRHSVPELLPHPAGGEQSVRRAYAGRGKASGYGKCGAGTLSGRPVPPGGGPGPADGAAADLYLPGTGPHRGCQPGVSGPAVLEPGVQRHEIHSPGRDRGRVPALRPGLRAAVGEGQRLRHSAGQAGPAV